MAKRITTDAKIVLERAGYLTEYVYINGKVSALKVWTEHFNFICELPVIGACIKNSLIEDLLEKIRDKKHP